MKFIDRLKLLGFKNYSDYLKCDHWLNFKRLYFETHIKNCINLTDSQTAQGWIIKGKSKGRPDLNEILRWCKEKITQNNIKILFTPRKKNLAGLYNEQFVKNENVSL
jgi:hypothetical protein